MPKNKINIQGRSSGQKRVTNEGEIGEEEEDEEEVDDDEIPFNEEVLPQRVYQHGKEHQSRNNA